MDGRLRRFHPQRQSRWLGTDSRKPRRAAAGTRVDLSPVTRRVGAARQLRAVLESELAATGVGARRARRRRRRVDVRIRYGGDHLGVTGSRQAGRGNWWCLPTAITRFAAMRGNTLHHKGSRSSRRRVLRCAPRRPTPTWCWPRHRPIPALDVVDLHQLAMDCRRRGSTLVVDNTTATPLGQQPLSLGADLVVASATKALSGHSDLIAGYVAGSHPELMAAIEQDRLLAGPILGPFEAWLVLRSLGTAGLRFERQCQNAAGARGDAADPSCGGIGPLSGPARRSLASGRIAADEAVRRAGRHRAGQRCRPCTHWCERSALLIASTSFGGIHTSVDRRARWGDPVGEGFARISLGIEDTDDLISDFEQALR